MANKREGEIKNLIEGQQQKIVTAQKKIEEAQKKIDELTLMLTEAHAKKERKANNQKKQPLKKDDHNYCGKILYPSESYADRVRKVINRDLQKAGKDPLMRSYFCTRCEAWHLTSVPHWTENTQLVLEGPING